MSDQEKREPAKEVKKSRPLPTIILICTLVGIAGFAIYYFVIARNQVKTDDAYVNGDRVYIHVQRPGTVTAIAVDDGEMVQAGQSILRLDDIDARVRLQHAEAAGVDVISQLQAQCVDIDAATASLALSRSHREQAQGDLLRRQPLAGGQALAPEDLVHARLAAEQAEQSYRLAQQQQQATIARAGGCDPRHQARVKQAYTDVLAAELNLLRAQVLSPISGMVAERHVQLGQQVAPEDDLMAVIPLQNVWVDANLKEGQLRHVRIGQKVSVHFDQYGSGIDFPGRVIGITAGSGSAFSLLPPQNAVGNWIKVVQRVPVRIAIDAAYLQRYPLRIGLSADVDIDTHDRQGSVLLGQPAPGQRSDTALYTAQWQRARQAADLWLQTVVRGFHS